MITGRANLAARRCRPRVSAGNAGLTKGLLVLLLRMVCASSTICAQPKRNPCACQQCKPVKRPMRACECATGTRCRPIPPARHRISGSRRNEIGGQQSGITLLFGQCFHRSEQTAMTTGRERTRVGGPPLLVREPAQAASNLYPLLTGWNGFCFVYGYCMRSLTD